VLTSQRLFTTIRDLFGLVGSWLGAVFMELVCGLDSALTCRLFSGDAIEVQVCRSWNRFLTTTNTRMPGPRSSRRQNELSALKEKTRKGSPACKAEGKACRYPRGRWKHNTGGSGAARGGERFGCYDGRGVGGSVSGTCRYNISARQKNSTVIDRMELYGTG